MSLQDLHDSVRKWILEACFGRIKATREEIGRGISLLGTIEQALDDAVKQKIKSGSPITDA